MLFKLKFAILCSAIFFLALSHPTSHAQKAATEFVEIKPAEIKWVVREQGVKSVTLFGDPDKPGLYIVRNIFPAGIMSSPHSHDQDRYVTVIRGVWHAGTSTNWQASDTVAIAAGGMMFHPAGKIHFDGAIEGDAEVQIMGMGPVKSDYVFKQAPHFGKPHKLD